MARKLKIMQFAKRKYFTKSDNHLICFSATSTTSTTHRAQELVINFLPRDFCLPQMDRGILWTVWTTPGPGTTRIPACTEILTQKCELPGLLFARLDVFTLAGPSLDTVSQNERYDNQ